MLKAHVMFRRAAYGVGVTKGWELKVGKWEVEGKGGRCRNNSMGK
jgi:hypothetical protein